VNPAGQSFRQSSGRRLRNRDKSVTASDNNRLHQIDPPAFARHPTREKSEPEAGDRVEAEHVYPYSHPDAFQMESGDNPIVVEPEEKVRVAVE
jgi:hypothetical protein